MSISDPTKSRVSIGGKSKRDRPHKSDKTKPRSNYVDLHKVARTRGALSNPDIASANYAYPPCLEKPSEEELDDIDPLTKAFRATIA
jgi:hypothetical protein